MTFINVLLPAPFSPMTRNDLSGVKDGIDVVERVHPGEAFVDSGRLQEGFCISVLHRVLG